MKYAGTLFFILNISPISGLLFTTPHKIGKKHYIKIWDFYSKFSALLFYYEEQLLFFLDAVISECSSEPIIEYVQLCQPRTEELPLFPLFQFKDNLTTGVSDVTATMTTNNNNFLTATTWSFGPDHGSSSGKSPACVQCHLQNNKETAPCHQCTGGLSDAGGGGAGQEEHSGARGGDWGWSGGCHAVINQDSVHLQVNIATFSTVWMQPRFISCKSV